MKEYTAIHYVKDNTGSLHTPGEIFESDYSEADEARLIRIGAVTVENGDAEESDPMAAETEEPVIMDEVEGSDDAADDPAMVIDVMEGISAPKRKGRRK